MSLGTITGEVSGLRFTALPKFLRSLAWWLDLEVEVETEKGWIREDVRYRVKGPESDLAIFQDVLRSSVKDHNR